MNPLTSWKEIGAYLGRTARTAQRWERSLGLPVHRATASASGVVWAFPTDIDQWLLQRSEMRLCPSRQGEMLEDFIESIVETLSVEESLSLLAKSVEARSHCVIAFLLLESQNQPFLPIASPSLSPDYASAIKRFPATATLGTAGPAALQNRVVITENIHSDRNWKNLVPVAAKLRIGASVAIPIRGADGVSVGCLSAYYSHSYRPTETDVRRFEIAGQLAGLVLNRRPHVMSTPGSDKSQVLNGTTDHTYCRHMSLVKPTS
jgi:hypothetical protein